MTGASHRIAWFAALLIGGCSADHRADGRSGPVNAPAIELLGFPGCPSTPAMRTNLSAALASLGKDWTFTDTNQEALPGGDVRRGYPAPTILVNGCDLYGLPVPTGPAMGCRVYPGVENGVPDAADIASRITSAVAR